MVAADLDETSKAILLATLSSPKTLAELGRILDVPTGLVWDYAELLERLGLLRVVLSYVSRDGRPVRYYAAELPIDTSDLRRTT